MNRQDYFKDIYKDFFNVESLNKSDTLQKGSQKHLADLFNRIDKLYITLESKDLLKKIIEYMRKYNEKLENIYIPFRIILNNQEKEMVNDILYEASTCFSYIKNTKKSSISLYKLSNEIDFNSGFITINNLDGINLEDLKIKNAFLQEFNEYLKKEEKSIVTISGSNEEINNFFLSNESLKNEYFTFSIDGTSPDKVDIYNYILDNIQLEDHKKIELLDYITNTYNNDTNYIDYQNSLIKYISFNKEIPKYNATKTIDEIFSSLNELVGLKKVKKVLYELVDVINLKEKAGKNLNINNINLHMVFLGNPGTGKTTIARIISEILYNLGYIKENKLIEVSSKDLIAEYVGQTAIKTSSVIEKSLNGVLFIDEAYTLAVKGNNSYNAEAIATLIQAMENYRDKLVVILAGYTKEMQDFLNSNSGIVSRIGYTLEFDDYTTEELISIFTGMAEKSGFIVKEDALKYLEEIIEENRNMKNFGNARFIRNIFEKTIIKHASNVKNKKQKSILKTLTKEDINIENLILK